MTDNLSYVFDHPTFQYSAYRLILGAARSEIEECLGHPDCRPWFISLVFRLRKDVDDSLIRMIISREDCPLSILALIYTTCPSFFDEPPASDALSARLSVAEFERGWERALDSFRRSNVREVSESMIRFLDDEYFHDMSRKEMVDSVCDNLPEFVVKYYARDEYSQTIMGKALSPHKLSDLLPLFSSRNLAATLKRQDIPASILISYMNHEAYIVRKVVAEHPCTPMDVIEVLLKDSNMKVRQSAFNRLPNDRKSDLVEDLSGEGKKNNVNKESKSEGSFLMVLRTMECSVDDLAEVARDAAPLMACAATLHKSSDQNVLDAVVGRDDIPEWALVGNALKTSRSDIIDDYIGRSNKDLFLGLSGNSHVQPSQAIELLKKTSDDRIIANIAGMFIESEEVIDAAILAIDKGSSWSKKLKAVSDPSTTGKALATIHNANKHRFLVLDRMIARHPNCPPDLYEIYAWYLKDDLSRNTVYLMKTLESGRAANPMSYDQDYEERQIIKGSASEIFCQWVIDNETDYFKMRKVISCLYVNPNAVLHLAVLDDSQTHRRFISDKAVEFPKYVYHMLGAIGSSGIRKQIAQMDKAELAG